MLVVQFLRKPNPTQFSIEGYCERVRNSLQGKVEIRAHVAPCYSRGVLRRIRNVINAALSQGDVNHVTGDIHYAVFLMRKRKTILTIHDCEILARLSGWRRAAVKYLWFTLPARRVSCITVNSKETKRQLLDVVQFPSHRVHVIPVAISDLFRSLPKAFDDQCPRILQVGTKANKNVFRVVRALQGLNCCLEIVGPVDQELQRLLDECHIKYEVFGRLSAEELVERYRQADIVCFVSTHEGFGMPIIEAQRVERVCVTSNCSSMPEIAGNGACFVDPLDVDSIRDGFRRVISDAEFRKSLIDAGRQNCLRFDTQQIADQFLNVYQEVFEANRTDR